MVGGGKRCRIVLELVEGVVNCGDKSSSDMDSSELKGEESLFAYLTGFGMLNWVESEKRMKLRKCGFKSGNKGLIDFYGHVL